MQLSDIQAILKAEKFQTSLQLATEAIPFDQLFVVLGADDQEFVLEMAYVPGLETELEQTQLLQFFVRLPCAVNPAAQLDLQACLLRLNTTTPLMGWGYEADQLFAYFRHVFVMAKQPGDSVGATVLETVWLIFYLLESFYPTVCAIATGTLSLAQLQTALDTDG